VSANDRGSITSVETQKAPPPPVKLRLKRVNSHHAAPIRRTSSRVVAAAEKRARIRRLWRYLTGLAGATAATEVCGNGGGSTAARLRNPGRNATSFEERRLSS
jgi:hypothetical protein